MSTLILGPDPWTLAEEADRKFRKIIANVGIPVLLFTLALPWLNFETEEPEKIAESTTFVQVLQDPPKPEPKPEPDVEPEPPPKPVENAAKPQQAPAQPKPAPVEHRAPAPPQKSAREIAEQSGLMQMRNQLAEMNNQSLSAISNQRLAGPSVLTSEASVSNRVAAGAAASSGGLRGGGSGNVTGVEGGTGLGTRRTGAVSSSIGNGREASNGRGDGRPGSARSLQEIQLAFDRSKTAFFAIFNRAARESGIGAGRMVVSLTIAPDGSVTRCDIVSSSFGNPELEQKILQRVRLLNFGAKDVPPFTYPNYPIDFVPS